MKCAGNGNGVRMVALGDLKTQKQKQILPITGMIG